MNKTWGPQVKWRTISNVDVVSQWRAGHVVDQDAVYADRTFGFKWNDALAISDPEARDFALNALAEVVDREAGAITSTHMNHPYSLNREDMKKAIDLTRGWTEGNV